MFLAFSSLLISCFLFSSPMISLYILCSLRVFSLFFTAHLFSNLSTSNISHTAPSFPLPHSPLPPPPPLLPPPPPPLPPLFHPSSSPSDLEFALTLSIDWVALSFVQKPEDIIELRALAGPRVKVNSRFHILLLFLFEFPVFLMFSVYSFSFHVFLFPLSYSLYPFYFPRSTFPYLPFFLILLFFTFPIIYHDRS